MKKSKQLIVSTIQVSAITLFIKFLGLVKQSVLAAYCGATMETDAFFISTGTMVNLCVIIFSAISVSLLSIHAEVLIKDGREKANELINSTLRVFLPIAFMLSCAFYIGAPIVSKVLAPTYQQEQLQVLSRNIRALSIAFVFWCYYLTINVVLETDKEFLPGKGQGFFQNIFLILGAVFLYPEYGIDILVGAFLLSGIAECVLVTWCARKRFKFLTGGTHCQEEVKQLVKISVPLLLGNAMYEVNAIVDGQIATSLDSGSASILSYGATIHDMVVGVVVTSVSTVLFSHLSSWVARGDLNQVELNLKRVLECLTLILLPIMVMCLVAGDQIIELFYGRGNFGQYEISMTYGVVIGYSLGFIFQAARSNLVKLYYAFQDSKRPMINGFLAIALNITLSFLLSKLLGVAGIALATSISMLFVTILLLTGVKRYIPNFHIKHSGIEITKGILAALITAGVVCLIKGALNLLVIYELVIEGILTVVVYILLLAILKSDNLYDAYKSVDFGSNRK